MACPMSAGSDGLAVTVGHHAGRVEQVGVGSGGGLSDRTAGPAEADGIGLNRLDRGEVELETGLGNHDHGGLLIGSGIDRAGDCGGGRHAGHAPGHGAGAIPAIGPGPSTPVAAAGPAPMPGPTPVHPRPGPAYPSPRTHSRTSSAPARTRPHAGTGSGASEPASTNPCPSTHTRTRSGFGSGRQQQQGQGAGSQKATMASGGHGGVSQAEGQAGVSFTMLSKPVWLNPIVAALDWVFSGGIHALPRFPRAPIGARASA